MWTAIDAAWPPLGSGIQCNILFVYYSGGTPHVWSLAEIAQMFKETGAWGQIPIHVRVPPTPRDPIVEASAFCGMMRDRGAPKGSIGALDYETSMVVSYAKAFEEEMNRQGYEMLLYGSLSTITQVRTATWQPMIWPAHWNNIKHLCSSHGVTDVWATQYGGDSHGEPYDLDVISESAPVWNMKGDDMPGPSQWTSEDWKTFWAQVPPQQVGTEGRPLSLQELLGYWPDGGIRGVRNDTRAIKTAVGALADDEAKFLTAIGDLSAQQTAAVTQLLAAIQGGGSGGGNVQAFVDAVRALNLPAEFVTALKEAL